MRKERGWAGGELSTAQHHQSHPRPEDDTITRKLDDGGRLGLAFGWVLGDRLNNSDMFQRPAERAGLATDAHNSQPQGF